MENFEKTLENLSYVMRRKILGQSLFDEAVRYFEILDSKESTEQEKHFANVLAEDLISRTRDIPDVDISIMKGRR